MNILMITSVYPQPDDKDYKTTPTVKYFCEEWVKQGHNVIVIHNGTKFCSLVYHLPNFLRSWLESLFQIQFPRIESSKYIERNENGVKIYRIPMRKMMPHGKFSSREIVKQGERISGILKKNDYLPNLIIGHWANPQAQLIKWIRNNYLICNYITAIVFHNDCSLNDVKKYSLLDCLPYIDVVGCRNSKYGSLIKNNLKLSYDPFLCCSGIPDNIVENTDIDNIILRKPQKTILFVGRIVRYKKLDSIIDAMNSLNNKEEYRLEIIGVGSEEENIKNIIQNYKLINNINIINWLDRKEVFNHMANAECFTLISENEVFGMVYLEAMLMGCITIASKGSALDGIIIDGVNGFLCNAGDSENLRTIYEKIASLDIAKKHEIMRNAHITATAFSDYNVADKYLNDIMSIFNMRSKRWELKSK